MTLRRTFLFLMAFSIPFEEVGHEVSGFLISPAIFFGLLHGIISIKIKVSGVSRIQVAAALMLIGFLITSLGRHSVESYILSLLALGGVIFSVSQPLNSLEEYSVFSNGFKAGLAVTIVFVGLEIVTQLIGFSGFYNILTGLTRDSGAIILDHNYFVAYYRPYGLMSEPANLGLYLVGAFVFLDNSDAHGLLRKLTVIAILLTGSVSAFLLFFSYFLLNLVLKNNIAYRVSKRRFRYLIVFSLGMCLTISMMWPTLAAPFRDSLGRVSSAIIALQQGTLVGSEASRANAYIALVSYWKQEGVIGMLFGTGYSNYSEWVKANFYGVGLRSSLARGDVNNMMIAVALSTGLLGVVLFLNMLGAMFRSHGARLLSSLGFFALSFQLFYGSLVSYFYWFLLFALLSQKKFRLRTG